MANAAAPPLTFDPKQWNTQGAGPRMAVAPAVPRALRGLIVQPYLDRIHGARAADKAWALRPALKQWAELGAVGAAPHGFTTTLPADVPAYAAMCAEAGLACVPAFGLNEEDPAGKADRIAPVLAVPGVSGVVLDCESAWEGHGGQFDAAAAVAMGEELTRLHPGAVVLQQPWPEEDQHKEYPEVAFARYATAHCPQFYFGAYKKNYGARRVRAMAPHFDAVWTAVRRDVLGPALGAAGGADLAELAHTTEGYGYLDCVQDYVDWCVRRETLLVWCEWEPDSAGLHMMRARLRLDRLVGLRDASGAWAGETAVLRFQRAYNALPTTPATSKLAEDGVYGLHTDAALFSVAVPGPAIP